MNLNGGKSKREQKCRKAVTLMPRCSFNTKAVCWVCGEMIFEVNGLELRREHSLGDNCCRFPAAF